MANETAKKRSIDVVFCIDGTGSMYPCINKVKDNAKRFHLEFVSAMTELNSDIESMRIKVIVFRDYECDANAMVESPFYELPADQSEFDAFLAGVQAEGGGDGPENGYEALYRAMCSDFVTGPNDRQVIALFTDADALDLQLPDRVKNPAYPADMVKDLNELQEKWMCIGQTSSLKLRERNKRLVIFAPATTKYKAEIVDNFNRCIFEPVDMAAGLGDIDFSAIIKVLAASAST